MAGNIILLRQVVGTPHFLCHRTRQSPPHNRYAIPLHRKRFIISLRLQVNANHQNDQLPGDRLGLTSQILNFVSDNFLPLALIGGVAFGLANPCLGCAADKVHLSKFSTVGIFVISGLTLQNGDIKKVSKAWPVAVLGILSILVFTPFFSKTVMLFSLQPQDFVTGLALFSCMPTTLSSGIALTQLAGGNTALAIAMTIISNLLGIFTIPFSISRFVAGGVGVSLPIKQLLVNLIIMLLIPLTVGKVFRESFKGLANIVDQNKRTLSKISAVFLSLVPWIQVSRSRSLLLGVKPKAFLLAIGLGVLLHITLLAFNALTIQIVAAVSGGHQSIFSEKENVYAFILIASQKTLPVLVAVAEQLVGTFGESGLLVLPCVAAHLSQIIMDSFLVNMVLRKS